MSEKNYFSAPELARELNVHTITLQRWRKGGTGPAFYTIGGRIRYDKAAFAAWKKSEGIK